MALRFRGLDAPVEVVYRKSSGSAPQPVDPYEQAAAQYGLATGTAAFNAGLNRTNQVNPLGSSTWSVSSPGYGNTSSGYGGGYGGSSAPSASYSGWAPIQRQKFDEMPAPSAHGSTPLGTPAAAGYPTGAATSASNLAGERFPSSIPTGVQVSPGDPYANSLGSEIKGAPPTYTQTVSLTPWANQMLSQPIDTSGLAGMPGGPSTTQDLLNTQRSLYAQQEAYLQPQQQLGHEQLQSQLAAQGIMPGSAAYNNAMDTESRANTFANNQAINSAITGGGAEQSRLFGLGTQGLQNQIALRDVPINEYNALNGAAGATANAMTPDISNAFAQQYQGALAGYNANVATNNANTQGAVDLASMAALAYLFA